MSETQHKSEALLVIWTATMISAIAGAVMFGLGYEIDNKPLLWASWAVGTLASVLGAVAVIASGVKIGVEAASR